MEQLGRGMRAARTGCTPSRRNHMYIGLGTLLIIIILILIFT